jgi:serine phosphatase RsbU (regulator of sigma subunit)
MTGVLAHAWDQLVLFMQAAPEQINSTGDIVPVLESIMDALGSGLGAVFLTSNSEHEWFTIPIGAMTINVFQQRVKDRLLPALEPFLISNIPTWNGQLSRWLFMPMRVSNEVIGAIGVGRFQTERDFDAADARILMRITERASGQIMAASLAESQARELQAKHELQIAGLIQRSIQPLQTPILERIEVAADWQPAYNVGGDAWGWVLQPSGKLACYLLDVSGKGLPAALAAVALHTALKMALRLNLTPGDVLRTVNEDVYEAYSNAGILATATVIALDPVSGEIEHASAGHPPVLLRHGEEWQHWPATMPPLGVLRDASPVPTCSHLFPNDLVVLYSDGLHETVTETGFWGIEGLKSAVPPGQASAQDILQSILAAAKEVGTGDSHHDDRTLVVVKFID